MKILPEKPGNRKTLSGGSFSGQKENCVLTWKLTTGGPGAPKNKNMEHRISTDQLLQYIDGSLSREERNRLCQVLRECPPLAQKLEGLLYLYEKFEGEVPAVRRFLLYQQEKVSNKLFLLFTPLDLIYFRREFLQKLLVHNRSTLETFWCFTILNLSKKIK
jgi:hypothetical protein